MSIAELFDIKQEHRAHLFSFPRRRKVSSGRRKLHRRHRKFVLEPLEPRLLLSAATIATPGLLASLGSELDQIKSILAGDVLPQNNPQQNSDFAKDAAARVPLINQPNPDPNQPPIGPPVLSDFLNTYNVNNKSGFLNIFQSNLIDLVKSFNASGKTNADFTKFLTDHGFASGTTPFDSLNGSIIPSASISTSYTNTGFQQTGGTLDNNGNGKLTFQQTEKTEFDVDLTFTLDQSVAPKDNQGNYKFQLDLGKRADLYGFTINPKTNEGASLGLDEKASFSFVFGTIDTQVTDETQVYSGFVNGQGGTIVTTDTPENPIFDPFVKPSDNTHGFDLSGTITDTGGKVIDQNNKLGNFNLRLGFLGVTASNGTISVNPDVHGALTDPDNDGFIKPSETPGVTASTSGSISADFDISGSFGSFNRSGHIHLDGNPFDAAVQPLVNEIGQRTSPTVTQFDAGLDDLLLFANLGADSAVGLLEQFSGTTTLFTTKDQTNNTIYNENKQPGGGFLNLFDQTGATPAQPYPFLDLKDFNLPFVQGKNLSDVLSFAEGFNQEVLLFQGSNPTASDFKFHSGLLKFDTNTNQLAANFTDAQSMKSALDALGSLSSVDSHLGDLKNITANYDPTTHQLTYSFNFTYSGLAEQDNVPLDLTKLPLDGLNTINPNPTNATANLKNLSVTMDLTFGYDLSTPGTIQLDAALHQPNYASSTIPSNGVLSGDATFTLYLVLPGMSLPVTPIAAQVTVLKANTDGTNTNTKTGGGPANTTLDDLVTDVQNAINAAMASNTAINNAVAALAAANGITDPNLIKQLFQPTVTVGKNKDQSASINPQAPNPSGSITISGVQNGTLLGVQTLSPTDPAETELGIMAGLPFAPMNGVLTSDVDFFLDVGTNKSKEITLAASATTNNTSLSELVSQLQTQIDNAFGAGVVTIGQNTIGNILVKSGQTLESVPVFGADLFLQANNTSVLRVRAAQDNAASTQLGFQLDPLSRTPAHFNTTTKTAINPPVQNQQFFIKDGATLSGHVEMVQTHPVDNNDPLKGFDATADFGFLGITSSGDTASLTADISLGLKDPGGSIKDLQGNLYGTKDGLIDLNELAISLIGAENNGDATGNLKQLINNPTITGKADVKLNNVTPSPGFENLGSLGTIDISIPDISKDLTQQVNITVSDGGNQTLEDFKNLFFKNITDAITSFTNFVSSDLVPVFTDIDKALQYILGTDFKLETFIDFVGTLTNTVNTFLNNPINNLKNPVNTVINNALPTVQDLQQRLAEAMGVANSAVEVHYHPGDALELVLNLTAGFSKTMPLNFSVPTNVVKLGGTANLSVAANAGARLDFGVDLTNPANVYIYDDTGVNLSAMLTGQNLNFTAAVGPVGLFIKGGTAAFNKDGDPNTADPVSLKLGLVPDTMDSFHRFLTTDVIKNPSSYVTGPALTGAAHMELPLYFPTTSNFLADFDFRIKDLNHPDQFDLEPSDLSSVVDNLVNSFSNILQALPLTIDGLDSLLSLLQNLLNGKVFDPSLPLVGDNLTEAGQFIESFRENLVSQVRNALDNAPTMAAQVITDSLFKVLGPTGVNFIKDLSGDNQITEDDIKVDVDQQHLQWEMDLGPDDVNKHTIGVTLPTGFDIGLRGLGLKGTGAIEVDMPWDLPFGFGVDLHDGFYFIDPHSINQTDMSIGVTIKPVGQNGQPFSIDGNLAILSVNITDNTGKVDSKGNPLAELVKDPVTGDMVPGKTAVTGTFDVGLTGSFDPMTHRLTLGNLGSLGVAATLDANAHLDLDLLAGFGTSTTVNTAFPTIEVKNFVLDWNFAHVSTTADPNNFGDTPEVKFDHINLNLGSFLSDFLNPIFQRVKKIGDPIKPVLDIMTYPIPVISLIMGQPVDLIVIGQDLGYIPPGVDDIAKLVDQFIGLADTLSSVSGGTGQSGFELGSFNLSSRDLLTGDNTLLPGSMDASNADDLVKILNDTSLGGSMDFSALTGVIGAGNFDATNLSFSINTLVSQISSVIPDKGVQDAITSVTNFITSGLQTDKTVTGRPKIDNFNIDFPLWEHPEKLFELLLGKGQNLNLITVQLPTLGFDYRYEQFIPIWDGLGVKIEGDIGAHINLGFGYDLSGIIQWADANFRVDALHDLLNGFYVATTMGNQDGTTQEQVGDPPSTTNPLIPMADLEFGIGAAAELNVGVASAGVEGKLIAELDLFAHDPDKDGRFHLNEIFSDLELGYDALKAKGLPDFLAGLGAPLALFDFHGDVEVRFFAYIEALFGAWRKEFDIVDPITLVNFTFNIGDIQNQPVLGEGHTPNMGSDPNSVGDGYLRVNIGPYAKNRVNGDTSDGNETVTLMRVSGGTGDNDETIQVTDGAGHSQTFDHVNKIVIDGGEGDDNIVFMPNGNMYIKVPAATIMGGAGNDTIDLTGFAGHATVSGGPGNDHIFFGAGASSASLGVVINGDDGADTIVGGPGPDTIIGGLGDDFIDGGKGDDVILGDEGTVDDVTLTGGNGNDVLIGGEGNDLIYGQGGDDIILGDKGTVGTATALGFTPNQTASGTLVGNTAPLPPSSNPINTTFNLLLDNTSYLIILNLANTPVIDTLVTDLQAALNAAGVPGVTVGKDAAGTRLTLTKADTQVTITPNVSLTGGNGNDSIYGGDGDDIAYGGDGNDLMYGEAGRDSLLGNGGNDTIYGGLDNDVLIGGKGDDILLGDNANITVVSGTVTGVTLLGGNGNDVILGDDGDVNIFGKVPIVTLPNSGKGTTGGGNDTAYGGDGADLIYGDSGNDSLFGNMGDDTVLGNRDDDFIDGGTGNDVLFGDNGAVTYVSTHIALFNQQIKTTDTDVSGNDTIHGGDGDDVIFGGPGQDKATGDVGNDLIFGDMGQVDYTFDIKTGSLLKTAQTTDFTTGDNDTLSGGANNDSIFGGAGDDHIYGDHDLNNQPVIAHAQPGSDVIIGDQGEIDYDSGVVKEIYTTDTKETDGGVDTVYSNEGNDIILGGVKGDILYGDGNDIMLGDEGLLRYDVAPGESIQILPGVSQIVPASVGDNNLATLDLVLSKPFAPNNTTILGDADTISGGPGTDIEMGGVAGDTVFGDANSVTSNIGPVTQLGFTEGQTGTGTLTAMNAVTLGTPQNPVHINTSFDLTLGASTYAVSFISVNDIDADHSGLQVLEGDLRAALSEAGVPGVTDKTVGDDGNGHLTLTFASQTIKVATEVDQTDILLGDNGVVFLAGGFQGTLTFQGSAVARIQTTDKAENTGGADTISGNGGGDIILGGVNGTLSAPNNVDKLYGDREVPDNTSVAADGDDVILGDNGELDFSIDNNSAFTLTKVFSYLDGLGGTDSISGGAGNDVGMGGTGNDTMYGDDANAAAGASDGRDILLGDNGVITLDNTRTAGEMKVLGNPVITIETTDQTQAPTASGKSSGGVDTISGNAKGDIIAGGIFGDFLYGDRATPNDASAALDGNDYILGDNARFEWGYQGDNVNFGNIESQLDNPFNNGTSHFDSGANDLMTLDLVTTELTTGQAGGRDLIHGDAGNDFLAGGEDADEIHGDSGSDDTHLVGTLSFNDLIFGDHGRIYPQNSTLAGTALANTMQSHNFFSIDTEDNDGTLVHAAGDQIFGEQGDDIAIGGQGDDRIFGQSGNDDLIGGHNTNVVPSGYMGLGGIDELKTEFPIQAVGSDVNDIIDGGSGDDAILGDNGTIWRKVQPVDPRFENLVGTLMYKTFPSTALAETDPNYGNPDINFAPQQNPGSNLIFGRDITLMNHDFATQSQTGARQWGNDWLAGGTGNDEMWGELGNDLMQGDGSIDTNTIGGNISDPVVVTDSGGSTGQTLYFNIYERTNVDPTKSDGDDYMEGNGGSDLMYGGLGQDDMIGGSSNLFGLDTPDKRPDMGDTMFGGAGDRISRNYMVPGSVDYSNNVTVPGTDNFISPDQLHARDADMIVGDNGIIYRLVGTNKTYAGAFLTFNYDSPGTGFFGGYSSTLKLIPRAVQYLDYVRNVGETVNGTPAPLSGHGGDDIIHGEAGDDTIHGMQGNDQLYGDSQDDDIIGGQGNDWISGGTGDDGVLGDDGLIATSRNESTFGEPLYGIAALHPQQVITSPSTPIDPLALNAPITTPGNIQQSITNVQDEIKKSFDLVTLPFDAPASISDHKTDDIIYGGLGDDSLHGGTGDDAISGAEALPLSAANQDGRLVLFDYNHPFTQADVTKQYDPTKGDILGYEFDPLNTNKHGVNRRFMFYDGINADAREKIMLDGSGNRLLNLTATAGTQPQYEYFLNFEAFTGDGVTTDGKTYGLGTHTTPGDIWPTDNTEKLREITDIVNDGNDAIFGDNGNDWVVGGTSLDRMYGGSGDDLLNIDDNLETNKGMNDIPDGTYFNIKGSVLPGADGSAFSGMNMDKRLAGKTIGADIAYGGAGLDVLMDNTGADRMIDWVGEFNSYITPYAPFGEFSVSKTLKPQLPEYLYALSFSDGADPSRAFDAATPNGVAYPPGFNSDRNGEPFGEMALVLQRDTFPIAPGVTTPNVNANWHEQEGPPRDQQAGNLPGGHRDVEAANDFSNPIDPPFAPVNGTWTQANGVYQATSSTDGVSLFDDNVQLLSYYELLVDVSLGKPTAGTKSNGFIVFDYYSPTDFKFAGIDGSTGKMEIGARTASGWNIYTQSAMQLVSNTFYNLLLAVNGTQTTLVVNGTNTISYTFAPRMVNGVATNLNTGDVGLAVNNAVTTFDNMIVQELAPVTVFQQSADFTSNAGMFKAQQGTWAVSGGRYTGTPGTDAALSTIALVVDPASLVTFQAAVNTGSTAGSMAGLVFDYYTTQDFKFAAISPATGQVIIGHRNSFGWFTDTTVAVKGLTAGVDYTLGLSLSDATVNVTLNGGQLATYTYDRYLNFGTVGLFSKGAKSSFDNASLKGDDPNYKVTQFLLAAALPTQPASNVQPLTYAELLPIAKEAVQLWAGSTTISGSTLALDKVQIQIADLPDNVLGETFGNTVIIDADAAGYGWFIDPTPANNSAFIGGRVPSGVDLLTVVMHEMGHVLGYGDLDPATAPSNLMDATLGAGIRSLPAEPSALGDVAVESSTPTLASRRNGDSGASHDHLVAEPSTLSDVALDDFTTVMTSRRNGNSGADHDRLPAFGDVALDTLADSSKSLIDWNGRYVPAVLTERILDGQAPTPMAKAWGRGFVLELAAGDTGLGLNADISVTIPATEETSPALAGV